MQLRFVRQKISLLGRQLLQLLFAKPQGLFFHFHLLDNQFALSEISLLAPKCVKSSFPP